MLIYYQNLCISTHPPTADISNSMKNANNTHQKPEEGLAYGLANVYFKKLIPSKNGPLKETLKDWVWGNNGEFSLEINCITLY